MADLTEIKKLLREIVGANPNLPVSGVVVGVDGDVCEVQLKSGLKLTDVKLKATSNEADSYVLVTPKVGSQVLMLSHSGDLNNMTVIKVDDVEKIEFKQNDLVVLIDGSDKKVSIKNDQCNLVEALSDLVTLLKNLKVFTPSGPSGKPLPPTITALSQFEVKIKNLLK